MNLSNIVTFDILSYYDGKIKSWVSNTAITGKADKLTVGNEEGQATAGNFMGIGSDGNIIDSGYKAADFQVAGSYKTTQTAVADADATTSGEGTTFVDAVTQNTNGEITVHKKGIPTVTASVSGAGGNAGLMTAAQAEALAAIDYSGKADKVASATAGHFASLDGSGNLADSGYSNASFDAAGAAAAVVGESTDAATANTVYGAKAYADSLASNYDAAGAADTAEQNAKNYADGLASNYATSTQGGYADSALQSISNGTDGTYVTTTVGSKTGNAGAKDQTIGVSVTLQSLATADSSHQGIAEASDVKQYVDGLVASGINYKGSVNNYTALLAVSNPKGGDMYNVKNDETISSVFYPGDMNYIYVAPVLYTAEDTIPEGKSVGDVKTEGFWDPSAPTINLSTATTTQIDSLFS